MIRLIRVSEVMHMTGLKKSAIYKRMRDGSFPCSVKIGSKNVAWKLDEIHEWIELRPRAIDS